MKIAKPIFKSLLVLFLIVILCFVGLVTFVAKNPYQTWQLVESQILPKDMTVQWKDLYFEAFPQAGRKWTPSISFQDLCIKKKDPALDVCLNRFQIEGRVSFEKLLSPEIQIYKLFAFSDYPNFFRPGKAEKKQNQKEMSFYQSAQFWRSKLESWLKIIEVRQAQIEIQQFELRSFEQPSLLFKASLKSGQLLELAVLKLEIQRPQLFSLKTQTELYLANFVEMKDQISYLDGSFEMKNFKTRFENLSLHWNSRQEILSQIKTNLSFAKGMSSDFQLDLSLGPQRFQAQVDAKMLGLKKPFHQLKPIHGKISIPQENGKQWSEKNSTFQLAALIPLFFVDAKAVPRVEKSCQCDLPEEISAKVEGVGNLQNYFSKEDGFLLNAQAEVQSLTNELFNVQTFLTGTIHRKNGEFEIKPMVDAQLSVPHFQRLARILQTQRVLIPAPLLVLDGQVDLAMKGPLEKNHKNWKIPFQNNVRLASERQQVNISSQGFMDFNFEEKEILAHIDVLIHDLILQLPALDPIYGVPKIAKDPRFELQPPKPKKKQVQGFTVRFFVQVKTRQTESIRLLSNLADPYFPMGVDIIYESGQPVKGTIALPSFNIEYLNRRSTVEKLELGLNQPKGTFPLNGKFRVDSNPYKIFIDVHGTLKAPHIILTSDPYLDRSDIISVLLYGRTNDRLVAMDSKTVGSFDAALADRAIGLLGIWAFASTPIQSFSYNQLSQQYTAQLKVTEDTTLAVGTNWEEAASLELQKRLSEKWVISASLEPTDDEETSRKLRLQWEDRF